MQITSDDGSVFRMISGSELWRWACDMDQAYQTGLVDWLIAVGKINGWPDRMSSWSRPMVAFALEGAVAVFTQADIGWVEPAAAPGRWLAFRPTGAPVPNFESDDESYPSREAAAAALERVEEADFTDEELDRSNAYWDAIGREEGLSMTKLPDGVKVFTNGERFLVTTSPFSPPAELDIGCLYALAEDRLSTGILFGSMAAHMGGFDWTPVAEADIPPRLLERVVALVGRTPDPTSPTVATIHFTIAEGRPAAEGRLAVATMDTNLHWKCGDNRSIELALNLCFSLDDHPPSWCTLAVRQARDAENWLRVPLAFAPYMRPAGDVED